MNRQVQWYMMSFYILNYSYEPHITNTRYSSLPQISLAVLEKLTKLVARSYQQVRVAVHVNDEVDCFKQNCVLGVGVLHLLRLWRLLRLVQYRLNAFRQPVPHRSIV